VRSRLAIATLLGALLLSLGVAVPAASAATPDPKVVIIVGATHGTTPTYRARADQAYAEARKYTSNVVKVYSPNATWSKVKSATAGASIVIYFGHGNGWPSPYTYDAKYTTKDGFGLNATAGDGDYNNKYYGEPYVSTLDLAPHAVVILANLCYASGNSEPGDAAPSQSTARKRVDNYGAGFLHVADAVIADGHGSPEPYIRALFTTHQTIDDVWRSAPNYHDHEQTFPSARTKGAVAFTDTDTASSGYYRSLVWRPGLTTDQVTGASYADTSVDPTTLQVPGNAAAGADGTTVYDEAGNVTGTIPAGTRLRAVEGGITLSATGAAGVRVDGLDDPSIDGWVDPTTLIPKDSRAPAIWTIDTTGGVFSPNDDGRFDDAPISTRFSERVDWRVRVLDGDTVLREWSGSGDHAAVDWDGLDGGAPLPDGRYDVEVRAQDAWENGPTTRTTHVTIDTVGPELASLTEDTDPVRWFSPNGDAYRDDATWTASTDEPGTVILGVYDDTGTRVRYLATTHAKGDVPVTWDGKDDDGHAVADGTYAIKVTARDMTGTNGTPVVRHVRVDRTLGFITASKPLFYPQDHDALAPSTSIGFTLTRPATVRVALQSATGAPIGDILAATPMDAGAIAIPFDGTLADGSTPAAGTYRVIVVATTDDGPVGVWRSIWMLPFRTSSSDTTPKRGQKITITSVSAEPLSKAPVLYVYQPGKSRWSVTMRASSTSTYKATITLKTGGKSGTVRFRVFGLDSTGHSQSTSIYLPLH
jgi:flagellar hook assembly protein FlgD